MTAAVTRTKLESQHSESPPIHIAAQQKRVVCLELGSGRYRARTCDLTGVIRALWPTELIAQGRRIIADQFGVAGRLCHWIRAIAKSPR